MIKSVEKLLKEGYPEEGKEYRQVGNDRLTPFDNGWDNILDNYSYKGITLVQVDDLAGLYRIRNVETVDKLDVGSRTKTAIKNRIKIYKAYFQKEGFIEVKEFPNREK